MRFPDIEEVLAVTAATFRRFPATLCAALIACATAFVLIDHSGSDDPLVRLLLASILGIALMFSIESGAERDGRARWRLPATGIAAIVLVAFWVLSDPWSETHRFERFGQLLLAFHLLAAFAAFVGFDEENGFWQFNKALFLRFWTATLFSGVLFAGLAVALRSIDALFGVSIDGEVYGRLFVLMALAIHPWIFLAGVPKKLGELEGERGYPQALKVFAQFILVPLVTVYLMILTAYLVKVVTTGEWPSGWIGWLVSSVSAVGTLALLLVHPVREDEGNGWVRAYARWFWVALIPSIVMLFFAIGKRISQYGFTERRYFLLVLAIWIGVVAVWFAFTRSKRIRFVPVSLAIIALVCYFGPWGAYSVSERSQVNRLTGILAGAGATTFPVSAGVTLTSQPEHARQVSDILRYLYSTHSKDVVRAVIDIPAEVDSASASPNRGVAGSWARTTAEAIGLRYYERWETEEQPEWVTVYADSEVFAAPQEAYDYVIRRYLTTGDRSLLRVGDHEVRMSLDSLQSAVVVTTDNLDTLRVSLEPLLGRRPEAGLAGQQPLSPDQLVITGSSDRIRVRIHLRNLTARRNGDVYVVNTAEADIYIAVAGAPPP